MNVFMPDRQTVVVLLNPEGRVERVSNNLSDELNVIVTEDRQEFAKQSEGLTFANPEN